jgi:hypothetical protein
VLAFALLNGAPTFPRQDHSFHLRGLLSYAEERNEDAVAELHAALASGERELRWNEQHGWLPALLAAWDVPIASQVLVFSKTSFQNEFIATSSPRAIYFSDSISIAWVPNAPVMEVMTIDPVQGPTFYTIAQEPEAPVFQRRDGECLQCHGSSRTRDWPGGLVRSVRTDPSGNPVFRAGTYLTTDRSPLRERWGGWYVSGTHGSQRHMGNVVLKADEDTLDVEQGANITDLTSHFDTSRYLSPHSDIVALMVMEHQVSMQNVLARASYEGRIAADYQLTINQALGHAPDFVSKSMQSRYDGVAATVVDHLLFRAEPQLRSPINGSSSFAIDFSSRGRRDTRGRSLRELHLKRRLFQYRCSFLIYSPAFDRLPAPVLLRVWSQLGDVLRGRDVGRDFSYLTRNARRAILEILIDTKEGLPEDWSVASMIPK